MAEICCEVGRQQLTQSSGVHGRPSVSLPIVTQLVTQQMSAPTAPCRPTAARASPAGAVPKRQPGVCFQQVK
jgi:hypothetical protein